MKREQFDRLVDVILLWRGTEQEQKARDSLWIAINLPPKDEPIPAPSAWPFPSNMHGENDGRK